jgi:carboxymethylenebutenolidase
MKHLGSELVGQLNDSAGEGRPALVIIHEWWGLNAQIRGVANRLAAEGYITFAMDLYHGKLPANAQQAQQLVDSGDKARWFADLSAAARGFLPRKVGVVGFSMGGAFALATAALVPDVCACVSFYGVPRPGTDLSRTRARVLGHYARVDPHVSPERLEQIEAELRRADVSVTIHRYDAHHSFFNEQLEACYSAASAKLAWERTIAFLKGTLG